MKIIENQELSGERALFMAREVEVRACRFFDGESPLKESRNVRVIGCDFEWKYPLWYSSDVFVKETTISESARSGIWYTRNITMEGCNIEAPKTFRRASEINLVDVSILNAKETMWSCRDISLERVTVRGDYFCMNCESITAKELRISGNYAFDGSKDVTVENSILISKDAFWNAENVTVRDSVIVGEYLGWNSKNVTFINCTIESNQGLCYMDGVKLVNCRLVRTDLAFEYSSVEAEVTSFIDSVKNPLDGYINAEGIGEIIIDENCRETGKCKITVRGEDACE